jgi:hypothetical protein
VQLPYNGYFVLFSTLSQGVFALKSCSERVYQLLRGIMKGIRIFGGHLYLGLGKFLGVKGGHTWLRQTNFKDEPKKSRSNSKR